MKVWANCIVHNEENFIWFALMSVIDYVDKILVWDTGSTDKTVEIIKEVARLKNDKIDFKEVGPVDKFQFPKIRQTMMDESKCDWILVLDGDEVWWTKSIKMVINEINSKGNQIEGIVVPVIVPVGDIYHIQEEAAGRYEILGRRGHLNLRAINKTIPGLHVDLPYGREGYFDADDKKIQEREGMTFLNAPYLHATHLKRSSKKRRFEKFKYELGSHIPKDFEFPEIFNNTYPRIVPSPWYKITGMHLLKASLLTPLRKIKRRFQ